MEFRRCAVLKKKKKKSISKTLYFLFFELRLELLEIPLQKVFLPLGIFRENIFFLSFLVLKKVPSRDSSTFLGTYLPSGFRFGFEKRSVEEVGKEICEYKCHLNF